MAYSTPTMLRQALAPGDWAEKGQPDPENLTNTAADLPDEQLIDAIIEADSTIESFLSARYVVPTVAQPGLSTIHPIDYWSRNIAAYLATCTFRGSQDFADQDPVARRYNATMLALTAVRDGKATIQFPENVGSSSVAAAGQPHNPFTGDLFGTDDFSLVPAGDSGLYPHSRPYWPLDGTWNWR